MVASLSNSKLPVSRNFDLIKDSMLQSNELPLAEVLDDNPWQDIFDAHEIEFGSDEEAIYTAMNRFHLMKLSELRFEFGYVLSSSSSCVSGGWPFPRIRSIRSSSSTMTKSPR